MCPSGASGAGCWRICSSNAASTACRSMQLTNHNRVSAGSQAHAPIQPIVRAGLDPSGPPIATLPAPYACPSHRHSLPLPRMRASPRPSRTRPHRTNDESGSRGGRLSRARWRRSEIVASWGLVYLQGSAIGRARSARWRTAERSAVPRSRSLRCGRARAHSWSRSVSWRSATVALPRSAPSRPPAWHPRRCWRRSSRRWPTGFVVSGSWHA
jgi:hypothetical protein